MAVGNNDCYYFISSISGNRAVLSADSVNGPIYAAMNTNNLTKVGGGPAPAPAPAPAKLSAKNVKVMHKMANQKFVAKKFSSVLNFTK